jgi:transcriptional regulator with XRE-family HTH domain
MARQTIMEEKRREKCWTQEELARRVRCSTSTICRIENLNSKPYLRTLKKIARALGVPVSHAATLQNYRFPL